MEQLLSAGELTVVNKGWNAFIKGGGLLLPKEGPLLNGMVQCYEQMRDCMPWCD